MRSFTNLLLVLCFFHTSQAMNEEKISKIICNLSRFKEVEIIKGTLTMPILLSKKLFKECNMKLRIMTPGTNYIEPKDIVLFASYGTDINETL